MNENEIRTLLKKTFFRPFANSNIILESFKLYFTQIAPDSVDSMTIYIFSFLLLDLYSFFFGLHIQPVYLPCITSFRYEFMINYPLGLWKSNACKISPMDFYHSYSIMNNWVLFESDNDLEDFLILKGCTLNER